MSWNQCLDIECSSSEEKKKCNLLPYHKIRPSNWSSEEQRLYLNYIKQNVQEMRKRKRKRKRVFVLMSRLIESRTSSQIKAHHQKLERKYKTIEKIIFHLQSVLFIRTRPPKNSQLARIGGVGLMPPASKPWEEDFQKIFNLDLQAVAERTEDLENLRYKGMFFNDESALA